MDFLTYLKLYNLKIADLMTENEKGEKKPDEKKMEAEAGEEIMEELEDTLGG